MYHSNGKKANHSNNTYLESFFFFFPQMKETTSVLGIYYCF